MSDTQAMPLSRFKVLDLTRVRAGPTAVRQLADWGADVIKIEAPPTPRRRPRRAAPRPRFPEPAPQQAQPDAQPESAGGHRDLPKLVRGADVLVENYRPDVKTRLGIDYAALKPLNPRLVYASISGFGQDGPYRDRAGFDQIAQGMGGLMSITGLAGPGAGAGRHSGRRPVGRHLLRHGHPGRAARARGSPAKANGSQTSLLAAQIAMLDFQAARWLIAHEVPEQAGNDHPTTIPTGVFKTRDGHINIASAGDEIFGRLCRALDAPELAEHPDYRTGRRARRTARRSMPRSRRSRRSATAPTGSSGSTRPACRRARSTRWTRCSPTRRSSTSASRTAGRPPLARPARPGRPGGDPEPHAEPAQHRQPRSGRAYRRALARTWLQRRPTSPGCASAM